MTWDQIKEWLRDHVPWWLAWTLDGLFALVDTVHDAWNFLSGTLWEAYVGWVAGTAAAWQGWLSGTVNAWTAWLGDRLYRFNNWLVEQLNNLNTRMVTFLNSCGTRLVDFFNTASTRLVDFLNSASTSLVNFLNTASTRLVDFLNTASTRLVDFLNSASTRLVDLLNSWGARLGDLLFSWGVRFGDLVSSWLVQLGDLLEEWKLWLRDRHEELDLYLFGEEGFVTGAINNLKEWVKGLFAQFAKEIILHLMDWMSYIAPPIEAIDEMGPHFSSFTDMLDEWAKAWKELKEDWIKEAMVMMEGFAAELRGEKEMDLLTPSETILQYWQMLTPEQIQLIVSPPIKG